MPRTKRKPGAQPGNQNARKHGFYSKVLTPEQQRLLTFASIPGIAGEIAILRMTIASIVEKEPKNLDPLLRTMSALRRTVRMRHDLIAKQPKPDDNNSPAYLDLSGEKQLDLQTLISSLVDSPDLLKEIPKTKTSGSSNEEK